MRIEQNTDADAAAEITTRIAYDREGRVTHRRVAIEGLPDKDVFYSYDLAGKVTAMVYPDGGEVHYAYDAAGRLSAVRDAEGSALAAYGYDNDGRMTTHSVGHTVGGAVGGALATGAYAYNVRDWVSRIDYPGRFTLSQAYDAVGNVTLAELPPRGDRSPENRLLHLRRPAPPQVREPGRRPRQDLRL